MTRTNRRGNPILDGVETVVAAARVAVSSATRSAFHRGLAPTSALAPSGSYRQARPQPIAARSERAREAIVSGCATSPAAGADPVSLLSMEIREGAL